MFDDKGEQNVTRSLRIRRLCQEALLGTLPVLCRPLL
jgi:hypothetical protein